jgi:TetR/AcrR family transcriptional repressor of nem operon
MNINRGSLYDTYGDKRALFILALKRYDQNIRKARLQTLKSKHDPVKAIHTLFDDWIKEILSNESQRGCFLTNTALELSAHDEEIGRIVAKSQKAIEQFFLDNIKQAQNMGQLSTDLDPSQVSKSLLASLIGMLVLSRSRPDPKLLKAIAQDALSRL